VFVCTFSGWVEAFPTWTEKAQELARCLWFRILVCIGSDNGLSFMAEAVQFVAKGLGITWKLHMAYLPRDQGK
jgi:transposase InsO family protein